MYSTYCVLRWQRIASLCWPRVTVNRIKTSLFLHRKPCASLFYETRCHLSQAGFKRTVEWRINFWFFCLPLLRAETIGTHSLSSLSFMQTRQASTKNRLQPILHFLEAKPVNMNMNTILQRILLLIKMCISNPYIRWSIFQLCVSITVTSTQGQSKRKQCLWFIVSEVSVPGLMAPTPSGLP